jgi:HEAT repeat protein
LIRLSSDDADEVREWATFGLGTILSLDTPEVRSALFARLDDTSAIVRDEALVGLARRRHHGVVERVAKRLRGDGVGSLVFRAADSRRSEIARRARGLVAGSP